MAATSQVFDEARHFYVLRDYLLALGCEMPPLDGYTHAVLTELLETDRLVDKLLGMQLIVESHGGHAVPRGRRGERRAGAVRAHALLRARRSAPRRPRRAVPAAAAAPRSARIEAARLKLVQLKIVTLIGWGTHLKTRSLRARSASTTTTASAAACASTARSRRHALPRRRRAARRPRRRPRLDTLNDCAIDLFFPRIGATVPALAAHRHQLRRRLSRVGDRALRLAA